MKRLKFLLTLLLILLIFPRTTYAEEDYYTVKISYNYQDFEFKDLILRDGKLHMKLEDFLIYSGLDSLDGLETKEVEADGSKWLPFEKTFNDLSILYLQEGEDIFIFPNNIEDFKERIGSLYEDSHKYYIGYLDNLSGKLGIGYSFFNNLVNGNFNRLFGAKKLYYKECLSSLILYNSEDIELLEKLSDDHEKLLESSKSLNDLFTVLNLDKNSSSYSPDFFEEFLLDYEDIDKLVNLESMLSLVKKLSSFSDASEFYVKAIEETFLKYSKDKAMVKEGENLVKLYRKDEEDRKEIYKDLIKEEIQDLLKSKTEDFGKDILAEKVLSNFLSVESIKLTNRALEASLKLDEKIEGISHSRYYKQLQDELIKIYEKAEEDEDYIGMKYSMLLYIRIYDKAIEAFDFDDDLASSSKMVKKMVNELTDQIAIFSDNTLRNPEKDLELDIAEVEKHSDYYQYIRSLKKAVRLEIEIDDAETQYDLNYASALSYEEWDKELNRIYGLLKDKLFTSEMDELRSEQKEWIKFRDSEAEKDGAEYEGGSMRPLIMTMSNIHSTRVRTLQLINLYFDRDIDSLIDLDLIDFFLGGEDGIEEKEDPKEEVEEKEVQEKPGTGVNKGDNTKTPSKVNQYVDYLNMTIGDIEALHGSGYSLLDYIYSGGSRGFYYETADPIIIYYYLTGNLNKPSTNERIKFIEIGPASKGKNEIIIADLSLSSTLKDLKKYSPDYYYDDSEGNGHVYSFDYDKYYIVYSWSGPEANKPGENDKPTMVTVYLR